MDKYVSHSNSHVIDTYGVDILLRYSWMDSIGTINTYVKKKFLKLCYKKNKIRLHGI